MTRAEAELWAWWRYGEGEAPTLSGESPGDVEGRVELVDLDTSVLSMSSAQMFDLGLVPASVALPERLGGLGVLPGELRRDVRSIQRYVDTYQGRVERTLRELERTISSANELIARLGSGEIEDRLEAYRELRRLRRELRKIDRMTRQFEYVELEIERRGGVDYLQELIGVVESLMERVRDA